MPGYDRRLRVAGDVTAGDQPTAVTVVGLLRTRHDAIDAVLRRWEASSGDPTAWAALLARRATVVLVRHFVLAEVCLLPMVSARLPDGSALVEDQLDEHDHLECLLEMIESFRPTDPRFWPTAQLVISTVRAHLGVEAELCGRLDGICGDDALDGLRRRFAG